MSVFSMGKAFLKKHPEFSKIAAHAYNFIALNRIRGKRGNKLDFGTSFLKKSKITIKGKNNKVVLGEHCYLSKSSIHIVGNNNTLIIGDFVCAHSGGFCFEGDGNTIIVGERTLICGPCHMAAIEGKTIEIGKNCLFSSDTLFRTGDSHSVLDMAGNRINPAKDICIGDRVWLGTRAMCMKGSALANDSVLSAGAILTKAVETPNVICAGVPAKIVKENVKWCRERV